MSSPNALTEHPTAQTRRSSLSVQAEVSRRCGSTATAIASPPVSWGGRIGCRRDGAGDDRACPFGMWMVSVMDRAVVGQMRDAGRRSSGPTNRRSRATAFTLVSASSRPNRRC